MLGRNLTILLLLLGSAPMAIAQLTQNGRYEMPLADSERDPFQTISLGYNGLLMHRRLDGSEEDQIELIRLDTALTEVWRGFIPINAQLSLLHAEYKDDFVFLLFKNQQQAQAEFLIAAVQTDKGEYGSYTVNNIIPFNPTEFVITNEAALIGGYFNYRPLILHFHFQTRQSKILPGFFNEPGELTQIKPHEDGTVDVIVSAKNFERRKSLWIRTYDGPGNLVKTIVLQPDDDKNLIFGRSLKTKGGQQVVAGVYGRYTEYSRGVFVARINEYGEYAINYYNFGELQRFFNYMKAKREQRVKDRIERRKIKGKKLRFNYRILVQELIPYGDQIIMLGEAFYPHYSYPNNRTMAGIPVMPRFYNNPLMRGDMVFDGYQYTHAVVIGFDKNGKLLWDNSFEINDVRPMQLQQFVKIAADQERIVLLYLFENSLRSKIIKDAEVLEGKTLDALRARFTNDIVKPKDTEKSSLDYWYPGVFFATGIQNVKNLYEEGVNINRRVFFINKIVYK